MLPLVMEIVVKSTLVSAAAVGLVFALRGLPAAQRAAVAHLGLLAVLATPLLVLFGPDLPLTGFWSRTIDLAAASSAPAPTLGSLPTTPVSIPDAGGVPLDLSLVWPLLWSVGSILLATALVFGLVRLFLLQRDAEVLTDREWLSALAHAQRRMKLKAGTALLRSDRLASPLSWGLLRPTIMLSRAAVEVPHRAEAIIAHELAHVVRLDWLNLLIARLATAVFWFNPLVWILAWQAHDLREEAADDVVLRGGVDGPDYAELLVDFARGEIQSPGLAAHGVAPGKASLKRRLQRVLDRSARREPARLSWMAACTALAALVAVPLAAFTPADRVVGAEPAPAPIVRAPAFLSPTAAPAESSDAQTPVPAPVPGEGEQQPALPQSPVQSQVYAQGGSQALSAELIAQMRLIGVTPEWIASLESDLPWIRRVSTRQMMNLAGNQVSPEWIRSLREVGYDNLTYEEVISLAANQIGPDYVKDLAAAGYRNLPVTQLVRMRIAGVDGDYARRMQAEGLRIDDPAAPRRGSDQDRRQRPSAAPPGEG